MAALRFIIGLVIAVFIALLAVLNRGDMEFTWSPIHNSITLPLYAVILSAMAFGFIIGGASVWLNYGKHRSEKRRQKKKIKSLEKEIAGFKEDEFNKDNKALPTLSQG